ncbi:MAG: hypothetical protein A3G34_12445 [Candidatus Lindowbacteria bacterium RIFCSPLOWO2_12_FULL_62_27]|nr:MAG: hypothetical protein A3I06_11810 [Candidatus Lindowbacteria bacterium RIFCSPLOWO2_02_FULL_62_12]OGH62405.1 MAG: hypothetical protein A3G34_12445 [Candidatus Lindowbacteria bacterium RIFCSPLOWO2_12_FULL_62_27]
MENAIRSAHLRTAVYELFGRILSAPDPEHGRRALQIAFTLGRIESLPAGLRRRFGEFTDTLARLGLNEIERDWQETFGLTDGGPFSLCESEYGMAHIFQKSNRLADISGFYRAFGVEPRAGAERPDHLSVEFEFLSFLAAKEAHALLENRTDRAEVSREAERMFLSDHTGHFCVGLFKRLVDGQGFYASVSRLGLEAIEWIFSQLSISEPCQAALAGAMGPEEPMQCGGCR